MGRKKAIPDGKQVVLRVDIPEAQEQLEPALLKAEKMIESARLPREWNEAGFYPADYDVLLTRKPFNVQRLLHLFPLLHLDKNYEIVYDYYNDGHGGWPNLYTRPKLSPQQSSEAHIVSEKPQAEDGPSCFLPHLTFEPTPLGYLQFTIFTEISNQFYLFWHAGYKDTRFIFSHNRAFDLLKNLENKQEAGPIATLLGEVDFTPTLVLYADGIACLSAVTFTDWGGFIRRSWMLRAPDSIQALEKQKILIPYDCGIIF